MTNCLPILPLGCVRERLTTPDSTRNNPSVQERSKSFRVFFLENLKFFTAPIFSIWKQQLQQLDALPKGCPLQGRGHFESEAATGLRQPNRTHRGHQSRVTGPDRTVCHVITHAEPHSSTACTDTGILALHAVHPVAYDGVLHHLLPPACREIDAVQVPRVRSPH